MTARCERTELLIDQCAHCRQVNLPTDSSPPFRAQYEGTCPSCDEPIEVDQLIRRVDVRFVHGGCAS